MKNQRFSLIEQRIRRNVLWRKRLGILACLAVFAAQALLFMLESTSG